MTPKIHKPIVWWLSSVLLCLVSSSAWADEMETCVQAYEKTQELKLDGKLLAAKQQASVCIRPTCPETVSSSCTKWLTQINDALPSIVVSVRDADGSDVANAKVFVDGVLVASEIDGRPIEVDPGKHQLRVEPADIAPMEQSIIVAQGVKNRAITVASEATSTGSDRGESTVAERGTPVGPLVLGGLALACIGAFAGLAAVGSAEVRRLRDGCGQTQSCAQGDVDAAKTKIIAGDVLLFTGIALGAASVGWLIHHYVSDPEPEAAGQPTASWLLGVGPTGGALGVRVDF